MKSTKCTACGFVGFVNAGTCKSCGAPIVEQSHAFTPASPIYSDNHQSWNQSSEGANKGLAIFALVLGIVGFFTFGLLGVGAVVGIIISVVAMNRVKRDPWEYGGLSLAKGGLVLNIISLVFFVSLVPLGMMAAIAIPNLYAARMAANEGSALSSLRTLHSAEVTYQSMVGKYGSLEELAEKNLIDRQLATGSKNGYRFTVELIPMQYPSPDGFEVVATPQTYQNSGRRSFFIDETEVIRAADNRGGPLTRFDAPLEAGYADYPPLRRESRNSSGY